MTQNEESGGPSDGGDDPVQALLRRGLDVLADTATLERCDEAGVRRLFEEAGFVAGTSAGFSAGWGGNIGRRGAPTIAEVVLQGGVPVTISINPLGEYHIGRMVRGETPGPEDSHRLLGAALKDEPGTHFAELGESTVRTEAFENWLRSLLTRDPALAEQLSGVRAQLRAMTGGREGAGK